MGLFDDLPPPSQSAEKRPATPNAVSNKPLLPPAAKKGVPPPSRSNLKAGATAKLSASTAVPQEQDRPDRDRGTVGFGGSSGEGGGITNSSITSSSIANGSNNSSSGGGVVITNSSITNGSSNSSSGGGGSKRRVRFQTMEEVCKDDDRVTGAMAKIASHIANPAKSSKAARLALQLLESGSVAASNSDAFFAVLSAAMLPPSRALDPSHAADYRALFEAAGRNKELFSERQQQQLAVWCLWADLNNSLHTDDSFQFSRACSSIAREVESLPVASEEEDDAAEALAMMEQASVAAATAGPVFPEATATTAAPAAASAAVAPAAAAPVSSAPSVPSTSAAADAAAASAPASGVGAHSSECEGGEQRGIGAAVSGACPEIGEEGDDVSDPFGLDAMLESSIDAPQNSLMGTGERKRARREEREKRRREEEEEAVRRSKEERRHLLRERRGALIQCVQTAAEMYKHKWAQTAIDILVKHAFDHRHGFTSAQQRAVEALWSQVRDQQHRRKHGGGGAAAAAGGRLDVTAFERLQRHYESEAISIRGGMGSGGRQSMTWLG